MNTRTFVHYNIHPRAAPVKRFSKNSDKPKETVRARKTQEKPHQGQKLFGKTNGCGMIIGEIVTGDVATYEGLLGVSVLEFKLWPESDWVESPGGLGVRHTPAMKHLEKE